MVFAGELSSAGSILRRLPPPLLAVRIATADRRFNLPNLVTSWFQ